MEMKTLHTISEWRVVINRGAARVINNVCHSDARSV